MLLAVFNLLPGAPLDGGRIVRAVRWAWHGNRYRAMREAGHAGRVIGWVIGGLGLWLMLIRQPNGIFLALTGLFIAMNARAEIMHAGVAERLGGVTVGQLTWYGIAEAGTDMDADSMIWQRQRLGAAARSPCVATTASSTDWCSRTSCGPSRSSSGRGRC